MFGRSSCARRRVRTPARRLAGLLVTMVLVAGCTSGGADRGPEDSPLPTDAVQEFIGDWTRLDLDKAAALTSEPGEAGQLLTAVTQNLDPIDVRITAGQPTSTGDADATVPVTFAWDLKSAGTWTYDATWTWHRIGSGGERPVVAGLVADRGPSPARCRPDHRRADQRVHRRATRRPGQPTAPRPGHGVLGAAGRGQGRRSGRHRGETVVRAHEVRQDADRQGDRRRCAQGRPVDRVHGGEPAGNRLRHRAREVGRPEGRHHAERNSRSAADQGLRRTTARCRWSRWPPSSPRARPAGGSWPSTRPARRSPRWPSKLAKDGPEGHADPGHGDADGGRKGPGDGHRTGRPGGHPAEHRGDPDGRAERRRRRPGPARADRASTRPARRSRSSPRPRPSTAS